MPDDRQSWRPGRSSFLLMAIVCGALSAPDSGKNAAGDDSTPSADAPLVTIALENSHLGYTYVGAGGVRYFVTEIRLTNNVDRELSVPIAEFELRVDGFPHRADIEHPKLAGYEFRVKGTLHRFRDLEPSEALTLSEGTSGSVWVVFTDLPRTADIPDMELAIELEDIEHTLDVNAHYEELLGLRVQRIGPRQALGLLTINGTLNTINIGALVEQIDRLAADQISRVVVTFSDEAAELDHPLDDWLRQTAQGIQTSRTYAMFPAIVSTIREFHVAAIPGSGTSGTGAHDHVTAAAAVEEALASAYRGLGADEIVDEIAQGHPLAQASALVSGGADLAREHLPLLLDRASSSNRLLRRGAFIALSGSGDPAAIQTLVEQATSSDAQDAALAIECLAASRFYGSHEELAALLDERLAVDHVTLVRILARYPRPEWADYLARLAADNRLATTDVRREAVTALGRIGHPQLGEILSDALQSPDDALQKAAFYLLLSREDAFSERVALEYALEQLDGSEPSPQMLQLFDRVRDPRIAPRLTALLDQEEWDRNAIINTLARVGSSDVADELADRFDSFKPTEQGTVLTSLTNLRSPRLVPLAKSSLSSQHDSVFNAAVRSLGLFADDESIAALSERLMLETETSRVSNLGKALEDIGTQQAVRALEVAKNASQGDKRAVIAKRLLALRLKSPGGPHLRRANLYVEEEDHAKAVEHFTLAIARDPDLSPAYSGRGHCHLKLENYDQAKEDFRHGMELDPDDGLAVAGLGITLAIEGNIDSAVRIVEEASNRFEKDVLFAYNAACVYGRVLEHLPADSDDPQIKDHRQRYEKTALARLAASIEMGFEQFDWMKQDPDLVSLRGVAEFQKLVADGDSSSPDEEGLRNPQPSLPPPPQTPRRPEPGEQ